LLARPLRRRHPPLELGQVGKDYSESPSNLTTLRLRPFGLERDYSESLFTLATRRAGVWTSGSGPFGLEKYRHLAFRCALARVVVSVLRGSGDPKVPNLLLDYLALARANSLRVISPRSLPSAMTAMCSTPSSRIKCSAPRAGAPGSIAGADSMGSIARSM